MNVAPLPGALGSVGAGVPDGLAGGLCALLVLVVGAELGLAGLGGFDGVAAFVLFAGAVMPWLAVWSAVWPAPVALLRGAEPNFG
jgi:hypothetical protein